MPLQKNLNVKPYYADYNPLSDYYQVLYKAGYPIQARELTNMQSMLQNQIEQFMSRFLKEGDNVVPGEFGYSVSAYVRVSSITQGATAEDFVDYTLVGAVSGVRAKVNFATAATDDDDVTFYVNYEGSGTTSEFATFIEGETLESTNPNRFTATVGVTGVSKPLTITVNGVTTNSPPMGLGSLFAVSEGYYFVDGLAVRNLKQTITLEKYSDRPTCNVGFVVSEEFITSAEDPILLDNARGASNFAAPGADRLKITLTLQQRPTDTANVNFIKLGEIVQGNFQAKPDQTVKWDWLYDVLAKRTFDESGDYIVTEFPIETLEYWNSETVNGLFDVDPLTETYPPVPGSGSDVPLTLAQADEKYVIKISPGSAYVQGYEVSFTRPIYLYGNKARTQSFRENAITQITPGFNIAITNLSSIPDFANFNLNTLRSKAFDTITLYRNFTDGYVGEATQINSITGEVQPFNIGNPPPTTYHCIMNQNFTGTISGAGISVIYQGTNSCVVTSAVTPIKRGSSLGGAIVMVVEEIHALPSGILNPRYLLPDSIVQLTDGSTTVQATGNTANGINGYNSSYDLGILTSTYFTQLALVKDTSSVNFNDSWTVGDLVYGEKTGSTGVVEEGSRYNILILSGIQGEFEPGEDVYQPGATSAQDKVSTISTEGEAYTLSFYDEGNVGGPSLSAETSITVSALGATTTLTKGTDFEYNLTNNSLDLLPPGRNLLRNFPFPEGSVLNTRMNLELQTLPGQVNGYAVILAGKIINNLSITKSLFSELQDVNDFSADISAQTTSDAEVVTIANSALFSCAAGSNQIQCDNFSGDPSEQLVFGDVITFTDDTGVERSKMVYFVTKPVGYGNERNKSIIYTTTTCEQSVNGKTIERIRVKSKGTPDQNMIFQLPQDVVASLQNDPVSTRINYFVLQEFNVQVQGGTNTVVLKTSKANEYFVSNANQTIISVSSLPADPSNNSGLFGKQLSIASIDTSTDQGRTVTYTLNGNLATTTNLKVLAPVYVTNAQAKTKTIISGHKISVTAEYSGNRVISLGKADVLSVTSVLDETGNDIIGNYTFDNGQRDNVYEIATLILKEGAPAATGTIIIEYNYFQHEGDGDFFSVDSYTADFGTGFRAVPSYSPIAGIPRNSERTSNTALELRDCVDFRPIVNTSTNPSYLPRISPGKDATNSINFGDASAWSGNAFAPRIPIAGTNFQCDLSFYLPKIDSLFIECNGAATLIEGTPGTNPVEPPDLATGIRLYNLFLPPYGFETKTIGVQKFNYKRYRMKDIADIERRIQRLEELVTLSILEQSALNMSVRDAVTGLDRFKNGIVVDAFRDHALGETGNTQYRNSVDPRQTHLRAPHFTDQVELAEESQTPEQRRGNGYRKTGPLLTVDYDSIRFIQNPNATRFINLQPYSVFTYDGSMELTPSVDTWQDITQLPDLIIRDTNLFDAMQNLTGEMAASGIGTVWGDWETTGKTRTNTSTRVFKGQSNEERRAAQAALEVFGIEVGRVENAETVERFLGAVAPIRITDTTESVQLARQQTRTTINVEAGATKDTSYGERVVDVQLARTCRTIPIQVVAGRLKPNTRYYLFFDDVDCSQWFAVDNTSNDFPDGASRYTGTAGSDSKGFGADITSDDSGKVSGVFLVPNGRAPSGTNAAPQPWTGFLTNVAYQTSGPTRSFNTGERKVRLTTSATDAKDLSQVEGFAEASFSASGVLLDKQETIVSTVLPEFSSSTEVIATENRWEEGDTTTSANYYDPVAQSFLIDSNNPEGVFVTELDVFFRTKDATQGVEAYIVTTDGQVPTEQILPLSRVVKNPDTILRVKGDLAVNTNTQVIEAGTSVTGLTSGASGQVKSTITFESANANATQNTTNYIYNLLLDNFFGEFLPGEAIEFAVSPPIASTFQIVQDEFDVVDVEVTTLGTNYESPVVTFSAPQLPGGVTATGVAFAGKASTNGIVYEILVTSRGSGYTSVPSVTITDSASASASGAVGRVRVQDGLKAVTMGVATSDDATAPTTFRFPAPVYLLGDTNYAFVLKAPTSLNYNMWVAKLGENIVGTQQRVTEQANLGSLFKSQNGGLWTEDQTQDVKFVLRRADFKSNNGIINLVNAPLKKDLFPNDPIETNIDGSDTSSRVFGENPRIVRVIKPYHGLAKNDLVIIEGLVGDSSDTIGGIPVTDLNTVHEVVETHIEYYTIMVDTSATSAVRGGGNAVYGSVNRPYEVINVATGAMTFGSSTFTATNQATQAAGVTGYNVNQQYRLDPPNEIDLAQSYYYTGAKQVASEVNEAKYKGSLYLRGEKSMKVAVTVGSITSKTSPVLNLQRTNATVVNNLIDNPQATDAVQGVQTATITFAGDTSAITTLTTGSSLAFTNAAGTARTVTVISHNTSTNKVKVYGENVRDLLSTVTLSDTTLNSIGILKSTVTDGMSFVPETNPNGSVYAKWLSRLFIFENACDGIQLKLSACYYSKESIKAYYRPRNVGFDGDITQLNWIPFNATGLPDDVENITVRDSSNVDPRVIQPDGWRSLIFSAQDTPPFDAVAIKIVMSQDNPALAPLIDDMQLVCSE